MSFELWDFGLEDYETVRALQKERVEQRLRNEIPDTLLLGEHPPVLTTGRGFHPEHLLSPALPVIAVERGGDITYHGPGQLMIYPIRLLPEDCRDLRRYLRDLEDVIMDVLQQFGLAGVRSPDGTGVWVANPKQGSLLKIASIGVAVKKWVTYHGVALNVSPDLAAFRQINPCGMDSRVMTSMQAILKTPVAIMDVKRVVAERFMQSWH